MLYYIPAENKMDNLGPSSLCICALSLVLVGEDTTLVLESSYFVAFLEPCSCDGPFRMCHKLHVMCTSYMYSHTQASASYCLVHISSDLLAKGLFTAKPRPTMPSAWWCGEDGIIRAIIVNHVWCKKWAKAPRKKEEAPTHSNLSLKLSKSPNVFPSFDFHCCCFLRQSPAS